MKGINPTFEAPLSGFCLQLSESLTGSIVPFDAASEIPLEEQRIEAMVRVQDALLAHTGPEALALLRAARSASLQDRPHKHMTQPGMSVCFTLE